MNDTLPVEETNAMGSLDLDIPSLLAAVGVIVFANFVTTVLKHFLAGGPGAGDSGVYNSYCQTCLEAGAPACLVEAEQQRNSRTFQRLGMQPTETLVQLEMQQLETKSRLGTPPCAEGRERERQSMQKVHSPGSEDVLARRESLPPSRHLATTRTSRRTLVFPSPSPDGAAQSGGQRQVRRSVSARRAGSRYTAVLRQEAGITSQSEDEAGRGRREDRRPGPVRRQQLRAGFDNPGFHSQGETPSPKPGYENVTEIHS